MHPITPIFSVSARTLRLLVLAAALLPTGSVLAAKHSPKKNEAPAPAPAASTALETTAEGQALRDAWVKAQYRLSPEVCTTYLAFAKAQARRDLAAAGKTLPDDFWAWVDGDPVVRSTVYGARLSPANILLMLRSLELDLGQDAVRKRYTQLALATAVVHASKQGPQADITPRAPLKLAIPPCPLKPVNTKDPNRTPDVNDHIINFLNEHFIEEVPPKHKWAPEAAELKYDDKGVAIPVPAEAANPAGDGAAVQKIKRPLTAADVMASRALQLEFNAYMKEHGQTVEINCGDHVIYPDRHDAVKEPEGKEILKAFELFKAAYVAKGMLPAARDPAPSPAEGCAFLIRNHEAPVPVVAAAKKKKLPHCPLTAPWPVLTLLAADDQPLRERQDIWERWHNRGELHTYGEYIGGIAQQFNFQSARRLCPYPFSYGTFQMMLKDGGVCGTMANMGVRTYKSLGIPASTAGQPGHCALILFELNNKTGVYECKGGQFATGGPDKTSVHAPWIFGDVDARRMMVYHQSVAWGVNAGLQSYLDSMLAYDLFRLLPEADRRTHGLELLESGLAANPYNFQLADAGQAAAGTPQAQIHLWKTLTAALAATGPKPGCPADSLYNQTVKEKMFGRLAKLPVPADPAAVREVFAFLQAEKCGNPEALATYQAAAEGLSALLTRTAADFKAHLASARTEAACEKMEQALTATAARIADRKQRTAWALALWQELPGRECYFGRKNKITLDRTVPALAKLAGRKPRPEAEQTQSLLDQVAADLKKRVEGGRNPKECLQFAGQITDAANQVKDAEQKRLWLECLSKAISGHEEYTLLSGKKSKTQRDPCAAAIQRLTAPAPEKAGKA